MGLLTFLRRKPAIRSDSELGEFIDANAAFLTQKGIYEYSRARAGHYAKVLFAETGFRNAVEEARWRAYPLGLAMVTEMAAGMLLPCAGERNSLSDSLEALVTSVFDRYPAPAVLGEALWLERRGELVRQLAQISLHAPKRVIDIPEPFAQRYFSLMPIHEKLRGQDFSTLRSYLRVSLCNIHDELSKRLDAPATAASLCGHSVSQKPGFK